MQRTFDNFTDWSPTANGATEEALNRQLETFIEVLQTLAGGPRGYRLRRILLTNFWLYGQQEFEIPHGRVFLAGENASGKSTVLTAALPLALDGDLRPNRIDTFGGRERRIEYYVLGSNDSATPFSHERRTAYIALEFEWCDPEKPPIAQELRQRWENGDREKTRFLTIGVSLAGNINASDRIRPLRFLITDGSRLGYDLHTVYETGNKREKRAYEQSRFKQVLEGHGIVCESQAEYERQVARYLFGFSDVKDFQKLINLLLVLRRPNLSTELNFSRVHDYLKQSLRKVSSETTSRVIGTIERIDAIQSEIERIQEAYDATERLHRARQGLALARTQLAACDYMGAQLTENGVQSRVNRLRKDLSTLDTERKRAETRSQSIQTELYQVGGQIKALEASEGLQVANRLDVARQRVQETEAQVHLQKQSLEAARRAIEENSRSLERQRQRFEKTKAEGMTRLRELRSIAAEESYWETAAFQLEEGLDQVNLFSPEASSAPQVPLGVTQLIGAEADERTVWLRRLSELHEQREKLDARVQYARSHETTRFQELDDARRRFQSIQDRGYEAQQRLDKILEPFMETHDFSLPTMDSASLEEDRLQAGDTPDDESLSRSIVEQFASLVNDYRQTIDALENELSDAADQIQGELNELQLLAGSKSHELAEAKARYEQKLAEPEFTPLRPTRRTLARAKLAEQGIVALPLYALLDFAPGIDSQSNEAGRIEYMLEDAGLLDALVVAPSQIAAADTLLAAEGLSDCRLDLGALASAEAIGSVTTLGLRFDTAVNETLKESETNWETLTETILATLGQRADTSGDRNTPIRWTLNENGTWTHGLLTGRAGGGAARCIGQTTRLRVRQSELDELDAQRTQLETELQELHRRLASYETQLAQVQEQQAKLRKVLSKSGIEEIYTELLSAKVSLDEVTKKYQKARQQTQEARQSCNALIAQLERESKGVAPLASDARRVQNALMGMVRLKNSAQSLQIQLTNLSHVWEEYQKVREAREQARINEANVARVYDTMCQQVTQAQAELAELQRIAEFANVEALGERLRTLREQSEALSAQLESAKMEFTRADERANNTASLLEEAEEHLREVQAERSEKQSHFVDLLAIYPVEELVAARELTTNSEYVRAAQHVLAIGLALESRQAPLRESDIPALKERVEEQYRDAYNVLARAFNREQPLLLEYGPDLDDQGHVRFLNEHKSTPVELLGILSERIEMQKTLLGQEERQLFEDFLLQEMAEAIRTHILEAEEWVQQINSVLSNLPMIGEHYSLQWKSLPEFDPTKLGSHLAQHYRLLRKPAQALTVEETETLMGAFRREIEAVRIQQQEHSDMNFMDALEQVFDYREWFHFDVWVTPIGGQRQRLTDRVAGTRSGAEQLFALYIPLFAALGAIYRSAAPGAPRLLALDEAFDKVSVANTQRIIEFLVSQDFQWIMTGPHISGMGAKIPACARYLMIHEKGSPIATASASFWSDQPPTTKDDHAKGNAS